MAERRAITFSEFQSGKYDSDESDENMFDPGQNTGILLQGDPNTSSGPRIVGEILNRALAASEISLVSRNMSGKYTEEAARGSSSNTNSATTRTLYFWKDGFSIDDGPLHKYSDPESQTILHSISKGKAPTSLFNVGFEQQIDIKAVGCLHKNYVPQKNSEEEGGGGPSRGRGVRLGDPSPSFTSKQKGEQHIPKNEKQEGSFELRDAIKPNVDESRPTTVLKIQMWEGTRVTIRINTDCTIGDLYKIVDSMMPLAKSDTEYILQTAYPVKSLSEKELNVEEASIMGSVLIQKLLD